MEKFKFLSIILLTASSLSFAKGKPKSYLSQCALYKQGKFISGLETVSSYSQTVRSHTKEYQKAYSKKDSRLKKYTLLGDSNIRLRINTTLYQHPFFLDDYTLNFVLFRETNDEILKVHEYSSRQSKFSKNYSVLQKLADSDYTIDCYISKKSTKTFSKRMRSKRRRIPANKN